MLAQWKHFKQALVKEKRDVFEKRKLSMSPGDEERNGVLCLDFLKNVQNYSTFCLFYQLEWLPLSALSSKIILHLHLVTLILADLCVAIEGPQLSTVDFDQVLHIYKQQNHKIALYPLLFTL